MSKISVIVPLFNEEKALPRFLEHLQRFQIREIVCMDGGSGDRSRDILLGWTEHASEVSRRLVSSSLRGRALQMNGGAKRATGEILLFLHADSFLHPDALGAILTALKDASVVGGAFRLKIDSPNLFFRVIAGFVNARSLHFGLPYGDQGYFVRRDIFEKLGGFKNLPLMEDVDFIRRLKKEGRIVLLNEAVTTSPRRWTEEGYLYTTLRNFTLVALYFLGVHPEKLAQWYHK
jgi:rSAM/selenodomain-associated transferase 2